MPLEVPIAAATGPASSVAGRTSAAADSPSTLVIAFGEPDVSVVAPRLRALRAAYPSSVVVGCSTAGHLVDDAIVDDGVHGLAITFEHTTLRLARAQLSDASSSTTVGGALASQLLGPGLAAVLLLADGILVNGSKLLAAMRARLGPTVPVFGGMAGDQGRFTRTWVLAGDDAGSGFVAAVGFYGDRLEVASGSQGGWEAFGPVRKVTASSGNRLLELDGRPALDLYKAYLGDYADRLPASALRFPLAVQHQDRSEPYVRTVLAVDEDARALVFAGDLPLGADAWLMRATHEMLIDGAQLAAEQLMARLPVASGLVSARHAAAAPLGGGGAGDGVARFGGADDATVTLAVSCVGRRLVLAQRSEEEVEAVREVIGAEHTLIGFYSNGEFTDVDGFADLQNQTMTLATLREV